MPDRPCLTIDVGSLSQLCELRRQSIGVSLRGLARATGVPVSTLSRLAQRSEDPQLRTLVALCQWLELPLDTFRLDLAAAASERERLLDEARRQVAHRQKRDQEDAERSGASRSVQQEMRRARERC